MTNAISIFNFKSTPVRTQVIDGNIWFCLIDVCDSLNLKRKTNWLNRLSAEGLRKMQLLSNGGTQETTFINEPNLYRLIFRSNKPAAVQFGNWVYEEVLPSIRKTGKYLSPEVTVRKHTRALPAGRKEIVLSDKSKSEIGGIVKAVVHAEIEKAFTPPQSRLDAFNFTTWAFSAWEAIGAMRSLHDKQVEYQAEAVKLLTDRK